MWYLGERCFVFFLDNEKFCEVSIKFVIVDENGKLFVVVLYLDF